MIAGLWHVRSIWPLTTLNRHSTFSGPAVQPNVTFVKRNATKRPLATSRYRPFAADGFFAASERNTVNGLLAWFS